MIKIYAITDDPLPPAAPVVALSCGRLVALCAPAESGDITPEALWRHEEVVESLMENRDLLPVRFGTVLADEEAVTRAVADREEDLANRLERVRGAVELAVRAELRDSTEPPAASGRAYMEARTRRHELAQLLNSFLSEHAHAAALRPGAELLRAAYLVGRGDVDRFVAAVGDLQTRHPELDMVCTGPWPPYSFAEGSP